MNLQRFLKVMGMRDFFLMSVLNWQVPLSSTMFPGMFDGPSWTIIKNVMCDKSGHYLY